MSEKLSIEILREKFKEAQEKGEKLILESLEHVDMEVIGVGNIRVFCRYTIDRINITDEQLYHIDCMQNWQIKQPKDEYEVLHEHLTKSGGVKFLLFTQKSLDFNFTGRKLLKNIRTGEVCEYDEGKLK